MLRIRMLSGEEVVSVPLGEVVNVLSIEAAAEYAARPAESIQTKRLLFRGSPLDDSATLSSPADLELVLLTHSDATETQVEELVTAAANGSATRPLLPDLNFENALPFRHSEPSLDPKT